MFLGVVSKLFLVFDVLFLVRDTWVYSGFLSFVTSVASCVSCVTTVLAYLFWVNFGPFCLFPPFILWGRLLGFIPIVRTTFPFSMSSSAAVMIVFIEIGFVCVALFGFVPLAWLFLGITGHLIQLLPHRCLLFELLILESSLDEGFDIFYARFCFDGCC